MYKFKSISFPYFKDSSISNGSKYSTAYNHLKPYMIKRTIEIKQSISKRGRPVEMDYKDCLQFNGIPRIS